MSRATGIRTAFDAFQYALRDRFPDLINELRPPVPFHADWEERQGAEELLVLWSLTSGQSDGMLGICGGLRLLGPHESNTERLKWCKLLSSPGFDAVAHPSWDCSRSLDPEAVLGVYFAAGWIPVLCEPLEANYLAVDLVPLSGGRPGQVILCGRDEDEKLVVAPNLATVFNALVAECRSGVWTIEWSHQKQRTCPYLLREHGRILSACRERTFPGAIISSGASENNG